MTNDIVVVLATQPTSWGSLHVLAAISRRLTAMYSVHQNGSEKKEICQCRQNTRWLPAQCFPLKISRGVDFGLNQRVVSCEGAQGDRLIYPRPLVPGDPKSLIGVDAPCQTALCPKSLWSSAISTQALSKLTIMEGHAGARGARNLLHLVEKPGGYLDSSQPLFSKFLSELLWRTISFMGRKRCKSKTFLWLYSIRARLGILPKVVNPSSARFFFLFVA